MEKLDGKTLNEKWSVGAEHALYRKNGKWYHRLERFPGALFDLNGYLLFGTKEAYENSPDLQKGKGNKNWIGTRRGIASIEGYIRVR